MKPHYLHKIFHPGSIAVIGASNRVNSVGKKVFTNLLNSKFQGKLYAINPKHREVLGQPCYANLAAVKQPIDLVVIATPAATVPAILQECGEQNIQHAIVLSAGFSEIGPEGKQLEQQLLDIAKKYHINFIGPNCLGIMRPYLGLNATFDNNNALIGNLALVSQSGALISAIIDWATPKQIGFSTIASLGNASDVGFGDILDYLALDEKTKSILLYIEGIQNARHFMSGLRVAARMKPVIIIKGGRHVQGTRAALSHTGALIGADDVFDAALKRAGAVRVITIDELFAAAEILSSNYHAKGNRLAIITNGGGAGVLATDRASDVNVAIPELAEETKNKLNKILPSNWSHNNPVDVIGDATPERYQQAISICLEDENIDGVLTILTPVAMAHPLSSAEKMIAVATKNSGKPALACWMGEAQVKSSWKLFAKNNLPCFSTPEPAVEAFSYLANYYLNQQMLMQVPEPQPMEKSIDVPSAKKIINNVLNKQEKILTAYESKQILKIFGIPVSETIAAGNVDEALKAAESLGYPVVIKINSPDITHKLDVGGVILDINNSAELKEAYQQMMTQVKKTKPEANILGVTIEHMYKNPNDRELMAGVIRDPVFGPIISFGAGGSLVEVMQDRAVALPPLNIFLAKQMIERTKIAKALQQFRGMPAVNLQLIIDVLLKISEMICELPEIQEMDINPLIVNDKEIVAVDARIVIAPFQKVVPYSHMAIHPYPNQQTEEWQLSDGTKVFIRPIQPEDAQLEQQFMKKLSPETRYMRFMENIQELTPEMLVRFTQIDYDREMALIAIIDNEIAGVVRYTTNPDQEGCEFAIVVADMWQNKGLGSHLLNSVMKIAKDKSLKYIEGEVLAKNTNMLTLMTHLGFAILPIEREEKVKLARKEL